VRDRCAGHSSKKLDVNYAAFTMPSMTTVKVDSSGRATITRKHPLQSPTIIRVECVVRAEALGSGATGRIGSQLSARESRPSDSFLSAPPFASGSAHSSSTCLEDGIRIYSTITPVRPHDRLRKRSVRERQSVPLYC
jgi:hypothetical protein